MPTVVQGDYEWDADKAAANEAKHGVPFEEAATVFDDPRAAIVDDGSGRGRAVALGFSARGRLLAVVYTERGDRDRIVSAWPATQTETKTYTENER